MKFFIRRTSAWSEVKPCDEAIGIMPEYRVDYRTFKNMAEVNRNAKAGNRVATEFLQGGENYRNTGGGVACDRVNKNTVWTIEINTLEELMEFGGKYGEMIIGNNWTDFVGYENVRSIEIYDDYRE